MNKVDSFLWSNEELKIKNNDLNLILVVFWDLLAINSRPKMLKLKKDFWAGMGKGRDGIVPRFFVPVPLVPRDFSSGTVPQNFVPVPTVPWLWVPVPVPIPGICGTGTGIPPNPGTTAHPCFWVLSDSRRVKIYGLLSYLITDLLCKFILPKFWLWEKLSGLPLRFQGEKIFCVLRKVLSASFPGFK